MINKSINLKIKKINKSNQKFLFNKEKIIKWALYTCKDKEPTKNYVINNFKNTNDHIQDMKTIIDNYKVKYNKFLKRYSKKNKSKNNEDNVYLFLMRNFKTEKEKKRLFSDRVLFCLLKFDLLIDKLKNKINFSNIIIGDYGSKKFSSDIDFNFELLSIKNNSIDIYKLMFYLEQEIYVKKLNSYPEFWNIEYYANLFPTYEIVETKKYKYKLPLNIPIYEDNKEYSNIKNKLFVLTIGAMIRNMLISGLNDTKIFKILNRLFNKDIDIIKKEVSKYYILPDKNKLSSLNNENKINLFINILYKYNKTYNSNINKIKKKFNLIKTFLNKNFKEKSLLYLSNLKSVCLVRNKLEKNLNDPIKIFEFLINKGEKLLLRDESYILLQSIYLIVNIMQEDKLKYIKKINNKYDYFLLLLEQFGYIIRFNITYCNKKNFDNYNCLSKVNKYKTRFSDGINIYNLIDIINITYRNKKQKKLIKQTTTNKKITKKVIEYHIKTNKKLNKLNTKKAKNKL